MYSEHFGLLQSPFSLTPSPLFFEGKQLRATLDALKRTGESQSPLTLLTGAPGSGKTVLYKQLETELGTNVTWSFHNAAYIEKSGLLQSVQHALRIDYPDTHAPFRQLEKRLRPLRLTGKCLIVAIDDAQQLSETSLKTIFQLSGLQIGKQHMVHFILFARSDFVRTLKERHLRPLQQQIGIHLDLPPLKAEETVDYLNFRLAPANQTSQPRFSLPMAVMITRAARGLPGRIDDIADRTLKAALAENASELATSHVSAAIRDIRAEMPFFRRKSQLAAVTIVLSGGCIGLFGWYFLPELTQAGTPIQQATSTLSSAGSREKEGNREVSLPATPSTNIAASRPALTEMTASSSSIQERISLPKEFGPLARSLFETRRLNPAETRAGDWCLILRSVPASTAARLDIFLGNAKMVLDFNQIWLHVKENDPLNTVQVIYGVYPDQESALAAKARLPGWIRDRGVTVRDYATLLQHTSSAHQSAPHIPDNSPRDLMARH